LPKGETFVIAARKPLSDSSAKKLGDLLQVLDLLQCGFDLSLLAYGGKIAGIRDTSGSVLWGELSGVRPVPGQPKPGVETVDEPGDDVGVMVYRNCRHAGEEAPLGVRPVEDRLILSLAKLLLGYVRVSVSRLKTRRWPALYSSRAFVLGKYLKELDVLASSRAVLEGLAKAGAADRFDRMKKQVTDDFHSLRNQWRKDRLEAMEAALGDRAAGKEVQSPLTEWQFDPLRQEGLDRRISLEKPLMARDTRALQKILCNPPAAVPSREEDEGPSR
jgi:hypothetical protein